MWGAAGPHTPGEDLPPSTRIFGARMTTQGFYHCSVKGVGRGNGASVVAKAAYRSGERLYDETTREWKDYTMRAHSVRETFLGLPKARQTPPGRNHERPEHAHDRSNARLATALQLALPH